MGRQYSAKTFLRNVPNHSLQQYFQKRGIDLGFNWLMLGETEVHHIFLAMEKLPPEVRSQVESDFRMVNDLAYEGGAVAILEEATLWDRDWSAQFERMGNNYERAFWTFLNEPQRFEAAGRFNEMDRCGGWRRRFVGYRLHAATEEEELRELGEGLRGLYRWQGRGRFCHVDYYERDNPPRYCYFAYPEDYANTDIGYDDQGQFRHHPRRSAFEIIFVYRPEEGMLEIRAKGNKKHLIQLENVFCKTILRLECLPDEEGRVPYDLSILKSADFPFSTHPRDRVAAVHVRQLRFDLPGVKGSRITISANTSERSPHALHDLLDQAIDQSSMPLGLLHVSQARLRFMFAPHNGDRPKTLTFEVTYPDRCTLKDDPEDQIAKRYLQEWGIARD
jgi:hypothetical protein